MPISDHNLVSLEISALKGEKTACAQTNEVDGIGKYNLSRANKEAVSENLNAIDWKAEFSDRSEVQSYNERFNHLIMQAIENPKVLLYKQNKKTNREGEIERIKEKMDKLERILNEHTLRRSDRSETEKNSNHLQIAWTKQQQQEMRVITKIK